MGGGSSVPVDAGICLLLATFCPCPLENISHYNVSEHCSSNIPTGLEVRLQVRLSSRILIFTLTYT